MPETTTEHEIFPQMPKETARKALINQGKLLEGGAEFSDEGSVNVTDEQREQARIEMESYRMMKKLKEVLTEEEIRIILAGLSAALRTAKSPSETFSRDKMEDLNGKLTQALNTDNSLNR